MNKYYKSAIAATELNKLPSFVNTTTDSVLYKLLNIPSVEIDYISKDIEETKWNIIPSTSNLYLPASVYWLNIDSDTVFTGFEKRTIFDFTFGLPTGYTDLTTPLADISASLGGEDALDIAFANPLYYIDDDVSKKIDEGFVFLLDGTTWFDQQLLITDTSFSIIDTISLDTKFQDIDNAEKDEWVTLTLLDNGTGQYTLANLYVKTSSVKVIAPLVQNAEGEYPYELSDNEFSYNSTTNTITIFQDYLLTAKLIVEYEYSPFEKLYSFTYLKDIHSVLTTTSSANIPFILPIFPPGYELVNNEGYELLVPEHIAGPTNYEDAYGNLTPYTVLFKKEFVNVGTAVKGTALFKRVHKFDTVNLSYGGLNSSDVPYWSALLPFTPESGAEVTHCFLTNSVWNKPFSKGTVEELTAEEEWEDSLYYTLTDNGLLVFANHSWDIGPLQFYTSYNFQHTINSAAANSPITYVDNNGDTQYYSYLAEIQSYTSWYFTGSWTEQTTNGTWIEYSLDLVRTPETSSLYIGQNAYPESLAWYPRTKYIEEDDFDQALLSVNKQHVETRSLVGTLLNRWAVPDSHTPLSVRRFKEYFVLLSVLEGDYFLTFYSIHDEEEILQIDLDSTIANPIAFTFNKKGEILIAGDGVYKLVPERKVYTELENADSDTNSFFYFGEDPSALGHTPETLLVEHTLDHWGRVIGNERWYNESLEEYLNRISNVVQAKGDTNKQKAIDGLSACFNETSYYVDTLNAITTSYSFIIVEETLVSTLDATDETVSLPTLMEGTVGADPSGLISIRDITQNTALDQTAIVLSNVTSDSSNPALHYSTLTIPNQSETHSYLVKYKSKVSLDVGTISDINYEDKSSNYGRLIVDVSTFNSNSLTDVTAAYYTSDPGNTYIDNSSPRNFNYKYVEETLSIQNKKTPSTADIQITDIQKADYATHSAAITDLLSTRDFKFKWDEFIWDKYRWQDGESIKTGVPTTFDASTYANGLCSDTQWTTQRECIDDGNTWTDTYTAFTTGTTLDALEVISKREEPLVSYNINEDSIVLKTGTFYYKNGEFFLYPTIPSYDLLTESVPDENILTRDGPTGASPVAGRLHIENILVNEGDDENDEQNNIDGGCGPANYTYPQGPAYDNEDDCILHGQCVVNSVEVFQPGGYLQTDCVTGLSGTWTAYTWTDGTRQMTNVVEGESFKQQYNYLQYREGLLRPMVDMSTDLQSLVDAKPYHSEVVNFLDDYTFTATSKPSSDPDPYFRLTNSIVDNAEVIVADFSNTSDYHDLYYTNDSTTEYDTGITITSDLLPDKKIFAVGDIDSVYSTITAIPQELAVKDGAIPDPFMIKVTVKDSEGGYVHNAVVQIEDDNDVSVIYPGVTPYTNVGGEVLIPIDISNITDDVTLTIQTTQEGEDSPSEDVNINTTLIIQCLA